MPSARRPGTNENIQTYGVGRDFTALATWEALTDVDLVAGAVTEVLECYFDAADFTDFVDLAGATCNALFHRIIRPAPGQGHDGTPNTGVKFIHTTSLFLVRVTETFSVIEDLVGTLTITDALDADIFPAAGVSSRVVACIALDGANAGAGTVDGFQCDNAGGEVIDCKAINCDNDGFSFASVSTATIVSNCTSINNTNDGFAGAGTVVMKNLISDGNTGDDYGLSGTVTGSDNNSASDITTVGTNPLISQTFVYKDAATDDFHLSPSDTGALGLGLDLSEDVNFPFNTDIDNGVITVWSIGADSRNVSLAPTTSTVARLSSLARTFRYVFTMPSIAPSTTGFPHALEVQHADGRLETVRISYPNNTDADVHLGVIDANYRDTFQDVFVLAAMNQVSRNDDLGVWFSNDDVDPVPVPRGFTGRTKLYVEIDNVGVTNATGVITVELILIA